MAALAKMPMCECLQGFGATIYVGSLLQLKPQFTWVISSAADVATVFKCMLYNELGKISETFKSLMHHRREVDYDSLIKPTFSIVRGIIHYNLLLFHILVTQQ